MSWWREHLKDDKAEQLAEQWYSCRKCLERVPRETRASWWCGWLARSEWVTESPQGLRVGPPAAPGFPLDLFSSDDETPFPSICPGYSTSLPAVIEANRALAWRMEGSLSDFYDGAPVNETAKVLMDTLATERLLVERHAFRFSMEKAKGGARE